MVNRSVILPSSPLEERQPENKMNPFTYIAAFARYPGWFEIIVGISGGLGWTILSLLSNAGLADRPTYSYTIFAIPGAGGVVGIILAMSHSYGLASLRPGWRAWSMFFSTALWFNVSYGIVVSEWLKGHPFPGSVIGSMLLAVVSFIVTVRLFKRWQ